MTTTRLAPANPSTPLTSVLAAAHDLLERAKASADVAPRLVARFSKKLRLAEKAHENGSGEPAASPPGTTESGLRAVLTRAEAGLAKRAPNAEQLRAIDALRTRLSVLERRSGAGVDLGKVAEALKADIEQLEAELARERGKTTKKAKGRPQSGKRRRR